MTLLLAELNYDLNPGATCNTGFTPLATSWQDCYTAAVALGFTGDSIGYVDYDGGWGTTKPEGCFESDGNGRIHFNRGSGGNFVGTDKILCGNKIFIFFIICLLLPKKLIIRI